MRVLGALLFALASGGCGYCIRAMFDSRRPRDVVFALLAPAAFVLAVFGLVLVFAPGACA